MIWFLKRLVKIFIVGLALFIGVACTLVTFGLIPEWGVVWRDGGFLWDQFENPMHFWAACFWFGAGTFYFERK